MVVASDDDNIYFSPVLRSVSQLTGDAVRDFHTLSTILHFQAVALQLAVLVVAPMLPAS